LLRRSRIGFADPVAPRNDDYFAVAWRTALVDATDRPSLRAKRSNPAAARTARRAVQSETIVI